MDADAVRILVGKARNYSQRREGVPRGCNGLSAETAEVAWRLEELFSLSFSREKRSPTAAQNNNSHSLFVHSVRLDLDLGRYTATLSPPIS